MNFAFYVMTRRVSDMDAANNIVPDNFLNLRPADYETRLASPEPHLYSTVNHCFHDLLEQCGIGRTGRRLRMHDFSYPNLNKIQTFFKDA